MIQEDLGTVQKPQMPKHCGIYFASKCPKCCRELIRELGKKERTCMIVAMLLSKCKKALKNPLVFAICGKKLNRMKKLISDDTNNTKAK